MSLGIGDVIDGKYRIVRLIGEGGMGSVFEGENTRIHRRVAIKLLHAKVADSEDAVQRFEREAQAAGRIGSEHIVEVLDLGDLPDGDRYMVMEYLEGEALSDRISSRGRMAPQKIATIVADALDGLKAAHEAGIIHRDLKPENVFLLASRSGKEDFVKIVDFGISKFNVVGGEFSMTKTGAVMGTPFYMSPEQAKGNRSVDHRVDLYAAGVILYEAVAGHVPFNAETFNELLFKIVLENPRPLEESVPDIDPGFVSIVQKAMARDPDQRFQTAPEFQDALRAWLAGQPTATHQTAPSGTPGFDETLVPQGTSANAGAAEEHTQSEPEISPDVLRAKGGNNTQRAWADSGGGPGAGTNKGRVLLLAAAAVVLVAAGGTAYSVTSKRAEERAQAAAQAKAEKEAEEERKRREEMARIEAERQRAKAELERAKAERGRLEELREKAKQELTRDEEEELEKAKKEEEEAAKRAARLAAARRRAAASSPKPAPKPQSEPSPSPAPQTGRRIRTDL